MRKVVTPFFQFLFGAYATRCGTFARAARDGHARRVVIIELAGVRSPTARRPRTRRTFFLCSPPSASPTGGAAAVARRLPGGGQPRRRCSATSPPSQKKGKAPSAVELHAIGETAAEAPPAASLPLGSPGKAFKSSCRRRRAPRRAAACRPPASGGRPDLTSRQTATSPSEGPPHTIVLMRPTTRECHTCRTHNR